jgi:putative inorganic carbon (HCO3(-)) transporter
MRAQQLRPYRVPFREIRVLAPATTVASLRWSREWIYFTFVMIAWSFTPLLRRLIDFHNGAFNPVQITSLVPFLMVLPLALVCLKKERLQRLTRAMRMLCYIWSGMIVYGFLVAAAFGNISAAAFEMVQYIVPMLAGVWLAGQDLDAPQAMRRLGIIILPCAAIVAVYGLLQWVNPPPWDVLWVTGSQFAGADLPVPFGMRVFSTLNAPGPAAHYFVVTMILAMPLLRLRNVWAFPLFAAIGSALLLTMVRESWVALLVGIAVYLLISPQRLRSMPAFAVYAFVLVALISSLPSLLGNGADSDVITSRIATFGDVGHDASAIARQQEISNALTQALGNPIGTGLGTIGAAARLGANSAQSIGSVLDSGYLARLLELGWPGFIAYLVVVLGAPLAILRGMFARGKGDVMNTEARVAAAVAVAICSALAWSDAANDAHFGLEGVFFWIAIGVGSLAISKRSVPLVAKVAPSGLRRIPRLL